MSALQIDQLFYASPVAEGRANFTPDEAHHILHVLRKKAGDVLFCTDGEGMLYSGPLVVDKKQTWLSVHQAYPQTPSAFSLHMAIASTKSFDRMEWCIEKLTEMGVQRITPLVCERSERRKWNVERARKTTISAMKQSKQAFLPICDDLVECKEFLRSHEGVQKYIAMQDANSVSAIKHYHRGSNVLILIGPEGDFTAEEKTLAMEMGYTPLSLGIHRLRTETAAVMAAAAIHTLNQ